MTIPPRMADHDASALIAAAQARKHDELIAALNAAAPSGQQSGGLLDDRPERTGGGEAVGAPEPRSTAKATQPAALVAEPEEPAPLKGDTNESLGFLKQWSNGAHVLTAIYPDRSDDEIETRFFGPGQEREIKKWLENRMGVANLYFSPNPVRHPKNKKAKDVDIEALVALKLDYDCPAGTPQEEFVESARRVLETRLPVEPSAVVDSGGGIQIHFILADPLPLNGDPEAIAEAKAINKGLRLKVDEALGMKSDNVDDVSRIMRLPGTPNLPNAKKRAKGRVVRRARVLHMDSHRPLRSHEAFTPYRDDSSAAPAGQAAANGGQGPAQPEGEAGYTFVPLSSYENIAVDDERIANLPEKFKRLGQEGVGHGGDRSRAAISFSKECWKRGIEPNVIAGMLMRWKIGECIRDKGSSTSYHLKRTIERGWQFNHDPRLYSMNEKHHVVLHGSKTRVVTWDKNEFGQTVPEYAAPFDFRAFHNRERVPVKFYDAKGNLQTKYEGLGDWWWSNPKRAQYTGIVFAPHINESVVDGKLNLWRGFSVSPQEGDCSLFLAHLRDNVCGGNVEYFEYLLNWMAHAVQHPDRQGEVAWCMRGREGTGKTIAGSEFGKLFGPHFLLVTNPEHLTGKFNAHLQNCSILLGDEVFYAGNPRHEQILKTLVTGDAIFIEPKGVNAYAVRNFLHIILCTNAEWIVPASSEARRWFVLDVGDGRRQDTEYFSAIAEQMNNGGRSALLHMLLTRDISNFNVRKLPRTEALRRQQALTRGGVDALVEKVCSEGQVPCSHSKFPGYSVSTPRDNDPGCDAFIDRHADNELRRLGALKVKHRLRKEWGCRAGDEGRKRDGKVFLSGIMWPPLKELRAMFEERHGPQEWLNPNATEWPSEEPRANDEIPF